ncbi:MAG: zf-HC2 domain-containing protein, partial [Nocardioides sp.]
MNHPISDIHALSGAYAVDALDDAERAQFEAHLATCPECRAEVRSFSETAALIAEAVVEAPPPGLRAGVLAGIGAV